ncbi:sporulation YhaL family protein [Bacillaceae bacterium S4-13-58]
MFTSVPLWVLLIFLMILFSGYMALRAMRDDYKDEMQVIEKEGQVYMDRIKKDRHKKTS